MLKNAIWLFCITIVIFIMFLPSYSQMQDLKQKNLEYQQEIKDLKVKTAELKEERRLLIEDPVYLEKIAREKMGLVKEGEVVYKIMPMNKEDGAGEEIKR